MKDVILGPLLIISRDKTGLERAEKVHQYDQRVAGERTVRFMRGDECLKQITMDEFLKLTGQT